MFSLIITILSIALVVAVIALSSFYGGETMTGGKSRTDATRLRNESQQILAAAEIFKANNGAWPANIGELVSTGYLKAAPTGLAQHRPAGFSFISTAYAQSTPDGWNTPSAGNPVYSTVASIPEGVCRAYNKLERGDDGILALPYSSVLNQCFGVDGAYKVVVARDTAAQATVLPQLVTGPIPTSADDSAWAVKPTGAVADTSPTDPQPQPEPEEPAPAQLRVASGPSLLFGEASVYERTQYPSVLKLSLHNAGGTSLQDVQVSSEGDSAFKLGGGCPVINPGSSCNIDVSVTPTEVRSYEGALSITTSNGGSARVTMLAQGVSDVMDFPGVLDFGDVRVGEAAHLFARLARVVMGSAITITSATEADFTGEGFGLAPVVTCSGPLTILRSCTSDVVFKPTRTGEFSGTFTIRTTAGDRTAILRGRGIE